MWDLFSPWWPANYFGQISSYFLASGSSSTKCLPPMSLVRVEVTCVAPVSSIRASALAWGGGNLCKSELLGESMGGRVWALNSVLQALPRMDGDCLRNQSAEPRWPGERHLVDAGAWGHRTVPGPNYKGCTQSHCEHIGTEQDVAMATKRITVAGWQAAKNHYNI